MKKFWKWFGIAAAVVVVLVITLAVLAKVLITPERVKETVLPLAREALQRDVALGEVEVSLFSGIVLKDLTIREREGGEDFLSARQVVLRYRFWPLLFGRVVVDEVRLDAPRILVVRRADGLFNFSDLIGGKGEGAKEAEPAPPTAREGSAPLNLLVSRVGIREGEVRFRDFALDPAKPFETTIGALEVSASDISLEKPFPFEVQARVNDAPLALEGKADPKALGGEVKMTLGGLDVAAFAPYYRSQVPGKLSSLKLDLDLRASGGAEKLESAGRVTLREFDLDLKALPEAPIRGAKVALDYVVAADLKGGELVLGESLLEFNGLRVGFSGLVKDFAGAPRLDMEITLPDLDLKTAQAAVPAALVKDLQPMAVSGNLKGRFRVAGPVSEPLQLLREGELNLTNVQASVAGLRPALSGALVIAGGGLSSRALTLKAGENLIQLGLKIPSLSASPLALSTEMSAERLDLDKLLPAAGQSAEGQKKPAAVKAPTPAEIGPFAIPLKADGTVKVASVLYHGLPVKNLLVRWRLVDNIFTVDELSGLVAEGSLAGNARVDLRKKGLSYASSLKLQKVQADPVVTALKPEAAGTVFGALSLNADLTGSGTTPEALKRNLGGKGDLLINDGKMSGTKLLQGLAAFLGTEELKVLSFQESRGNFTIENGQVRFDSEVNGSKARLRPRGKVDLDGALDLALETRLNPELTRKVAGKGDFSKFMADDQGWGLLPLKVTGPAASPRFALDSAAVRSQVQQKAKEKLEQKILDKLAPPPKEGAPDSREPARQLLKDTLKGVLGN